MGRLLLKSKKPEENQTPSKVSLKPYKKAKIYRGLFLLSVLLNIYLLIKSIT